MSGHSHSTLAVLPIRGHTPTYTTRIWRRSRRPEAWGFFSIFAMWMSDVHSVGGYTFAASLFFLGLTGWQVLLAMVVGITAVYFLMNLIGHPSLKYGLPSRSWRGCRSE